MKKIITLAACALFAFSSMLSSAQTDKKAAPKKEAKKEAPAKAETKQEAPATTTTSGQKLKKDGTPDKRYKENKEEAKPAGPTKKDGTPDMRHKSNKEAAAKKK